MMKKTVLIALLLVVVLALAALIGLRVFGARGGDAASPAETGEASESVSAAETVQPAPEESAPQIEYDTEDSGAASATDVIGD